MPQGTDRAPNVQALTRATSCAPRTVQATQRRAHLGSRRSGIARPLARGWRLQWCEHSVRLPAERGAYTAATEEHRGGRQVTHTESAAKCMYHQHTRGSRRATKKHRTARHLCWQQAATDEVVFALLLLESCAFARVLLQQIFVPAKRQDKHKGGQEHGEGRSGSNEHSAACYHAHTAARRR